ncbi:Ubiquitin carboxyl-terminal hydrolase 7 [Thelohanellus kitauei]|uniref:Ubiquitin carboxyl-terminal hydrolase n=1 Tax=Thelohanellus kitauei TaxID=669202 RepID=A0A0C2IY19_THEKT|nr:Ubiquitin carboxyl-terminal hydrolase 7 [Thelohanellus kitauei]
MTVQEEKMMEESEEEIVEITHETPEECQRYLSSTDFCLKSDGTLTQSFELVPPNKVAKVLSKALVVRGLPWKLYTIQNNFAHNLLFLSCAVICDISTDVSWSCSAKVEIILTNFVHPNEPIRREFSGFFNNRDFEQAELYVAQCPFVRNGNIEIVLKVAADPPRGFNWDSRKMSGYVGITNLGATCYLNSLLQTLFFAQPLRKIIFKTPTETDNRSKSVVLALQYTFMDLLYSQTCIDTKKLTSAFGWSASEFFLQHDVQEMCRVLIDRVEEKTKDTSVAGEIAKLMAGTSSVTIKCLSVPFQSRKTESFYDIQLSVKGVKDIYEAFDRYCDSETLDGDNKYRTDDYGPQDAIKTNSFVKYPPLLHIHLLRFVFNPEVFNYEKVYDKFEFYREINLDKYLESDANEGTGDNIFYLQSILVHCGSSSGGHYIAYVSPNCDSQWFKFDDDVVSSITESEAIQGTFGSNEGRMTAGYTAYMLLYIKSSMLNDPSYKFSDEDIPAHLKRLYFSEKTNASENMRFSQNAYEMNVIFDDMAYLHPNTSPVDFRSIKPLSFNMPEDWSLKTICGWLSNHMGMRENNLRLWIFKKNMERTLFPFHIAPELYSASISSTFTHDSIFFAERVDDDEEPFVPGRHKMILLHTFQKMEQRVYYHGFHKVDSTKPIYDSIKNICDKNYILFNERSLIFYEHEKFVAKRVKNTHDSIQEIFDNEEDVLSIIVQTQYDSNLDIEDIKYPFNNVAVYLKDLPNQYTIYFHDIDSDLKGADFLIHASRYLPFSGLFQQASRHLDVNPKYFRLLRYNQY